MQMSNLRRYPVSTCVILPLCWETLPKMKPSNIFSKAMHTPLPFLHQQSMGHLLGATGDIEEDYHPGLLLLKTAIYFKPGLYRITIWSQLCSIQGMHNPDCLHAAPECYIWYNWWTYMAHCYHTKSIVYLRFHSMLCTLWVWTNV